MSSKQPQIWYEHFFSNKIKLNQNQKSDIGTKNKNKLEHFDTEWIFKTHKNQNGNNSHFFK